MTREQLYQYRDLVGEVEDLARELESHRYIVKEKVQGSQNCFPYIKQNIEVSGVVEDPRATVLRQQYQQAVKKRNKELEEIERFMQTLPNSRLRRIVRLKIVEGFNWKQVADILGGNNTENSVKQLFCRYMKKNSNSVTYVTHVTKQ